LDMKDTTEHTGAGDIQALRVRDSTAAAATWLDMARYSDTVTVGISQRYTPGGGAGTGRSQVSDEVYANPVPI